MRKTKRIEIDGREIVCGELTVSQIRDLMSRGEVPEDENYLNMLFPERIPADAVLRSTGMKASDLYGEDFAPSDLKLIWDEVEEVNPFYSAAARKIARITAQILERKLKGL